MNSILLKNIKETLNRKMIISNSLKKWVSVDELVKEARERNTDPQEWIDYMEYLNEIYSEKIEHIDPKYNK